MLFQLGQPPAYETWRIALTIGGSLVTLVSLIVTAYVLLRSKTTETLRGERDAYQGKAERLEEESVALKEKVAVLEAQRDLTSVQEGQAAIVRAVEGLAANETERFKSMSAILNTYQETAAEMVLLLRDIKNTRG